MDEKVFEAIMEKSKVNSVYRMCGKYFDQLCIDSPERLCSDPRWLEMASTVIRLDKGKEEKFNSRFIWVTINPKPQLVVSDEQLYNFLSVIQKAMSKVWIIDYYFVLEHFTKTGQRTHVHILLKKPLCKRPSEVKRELNSSFQKWIGNSKHVDIRYCNSETVQNRIHYIKGEKISEEKRNLVFQDRQWRDDKCLQHLYSSKEKAPEQDIILEDID